MGDNATHTGNQHMPAQGHKALPAQKAWHCEIHAKRLLHYAWSTFLKYGAAEGEGACFLLDSTASREPPPYGLMPSSLHSESSICNGTRASSLFLLSYNLNRKMSQKRGSWKGSPWRAPQKFEESQRVTLVKTFLSLQRVERTQRNASMVVEPL
jgi:hypothetical protein